MIFMPDAEYRFINVSEYKLLKYSKSAGTYATWLLYDQPKMIVCTWQDAQLPNLSTLGTFWGPVSNYFRVYNISDIQGQPEQSVIK